MWIPSIVAALLVAALIAVGYLARQNQRDAEAAQAETACNLYWLAVLHDDLGDRIEQFPGDAYRALNVWWNDDARRVYIPGRAHCSEPDRQNERPRPLIPAKGNP